MICVLFGLWCHVTEVPKDKCYCGTTAGPTHLCADGLGCCRGEVFVCASIEDYKQKQKK